MDTFNENNSGRTLKIIFVFFYIFCFCIHGYSQITTDSQDTWEDATWSGGVVPTAGDEVILLPGAEIEIDQDQACLKLTIQDDATFTTLTINSGNTLTITEDIIFEPNADESEMEITIDGTLLVGDQFSMRQDVFIDHIWALYISPTGLLDINGTGSSEIRFWSRQAGSSIDVDIQSGGEIDCEGGAYIYVDDGGTVDIDIFSNDITNVVNGKISCIDKWKQRVNDASSSISTEIWGGILDIEGPIEFGNTGNQTDNKINMTFNNTPEIFCSEIIDPQLGNILNTALNPSNFTFDIAGSPNLPNDPNIVFNDVIIESNVNLQLDANFPITQLLGNLEIKTNASFTNTASGFTFDLSGDIINAGTLTISGNTTANDLSNSGALSTQSGSLTLSGNFTNTILGGYTATGNLSVTGDFTNAGTFNNNSSTLDVTGNISNTGNTLTIGGTATTNNLTNSGTLIQTSDITISGNYDNSSTHNAAANMDISGSWTNTGTYTSTGSNINLEGNWTNTVGTYTYNTGDTVTFDGTSGTSLIRGATDWYNLYVNHSGSGATVLAGTQNIYNELDIDNGTFTTADLLVLISNSSGTGAIDDIGSGSLSGNITSQRFVNEGPGWYLLASPITNTDIEDWNSEVDMSGFPGTEGDAMSFQSLQYYDETVLDVLDSGYVSPTNTTNTIVSGRGYFVYIANDNKGPLPKTLDVTGTAATDAVNVPVSHSTSGAGVDNDGWNLVGNPYPCPIAWNLVTKTNITSSAAYTLNNDGSYSTLTGSESIASGEAFWVNAASGGGSLDFSESNKSVGSDTYNNKMNQNDEFGNLLAINLTVNGHTENSKLRFHENATSNFDTEYDAFKINDIYGVLTNLSFLVDSFDVSVNTISNSTINESIPLRTYKVYPTNSTDSGLFEFLGISEISNKCIIFEDALTGTNFKLISDTSYSFVLSDTTSAPRFFLHVSTPLSIISMDAGCMGDDNGKIIVQGNGTGPFDYVWTDNNGDTIKTITNTMAADSLTDLEAGNYTVYVKTNSSCGTVNSTTEINSYPEINISIPPTTLDCYGGNNGELTANTSGGTPPFTYSWDITTGSQNTTTATGLTNGTYQLTVIDDNGCSVSQAQTITEPNLLLSSFIQSADTVILENGALVGFQNQSIGAISQTWSFGDGFGSTLLSPWYQYTSIGDYEVMLMSHDGLNCTDTAFSLVKVMSNAVGLNELFDIEGNILIAHNTNGCKIFFNLSELNIVDISVYNTMGQNLKTIRNISAYKNNISIDLNNQPKGLYIFKLTSDKAQATYKFMY